MYSPVSALGGASCAGFAQISEIGPLGMIALRGDLADAGMAAAVLAAIGVAMPAVRHVTTSGDRSAGWMSPDELLLILPYSDVPNALAIIRNRLQSSHYLAVDQSDARAVFHISGPLAPEVIAKLCPVDLDRLAPGELRRTRAAQVAAALWRDDLGRFTLICFRSVAQYMMGVLQTAAMPGSEVGRHGAS